MAQNSLVLKKMQWLERSFELLGSVDGSTYCSTFGISPQVAYSDYTRYSNQLQRKSDLQGFKEKYAIQRGVLYIDGQSTQHFPPLEIYGKMPLDEWFQITYPSIFEQVDTGIISPPPQDIFSKILMSILSYKNQNKDIRPYPLLISYYSSTSGASEKIISPHSIVAAAGRYHVRAFDHNRNRGADFVLGRIESATPTKKPFVDHKRDIDWNTQISLKLSPNSNAEPEIQKAVCLGYSIPMGGSREIITRQALVNYVLLSYGIRPKLYKEPSITFKQSKIVS